MKEKLLRLDFDAPQNRRAVLALLAAFARVQLTSAS